MARSLRFASLALILLIFTVSSGALFYKKQSLASVDLIKNDLGQDIVNSQLLQAERRVEILRRLGLYDLKLSYSNLSDPPKITCLLGSISPIKVDGVDVGVVTDCPKFRTIIYFLFGSSIFKFGFLVFFIAVLLSVTIPLYRYKKSIQKFIQTATERNDTFLEANHYSDPVVSEIQSVLKAVYLSKLKLDQLEFENKKSLALSDLARQVAHDIRSPLSALTIVSQSLEDISEIQKDLIQQSTQRINNIANELLRKNVFTDAPPTNENSSPGNEDLIEPISTIVDEIIKEKKIILSVNPNINLVSDLDNSNPLTCTISSIDLKRIISNLINNSIESFNSGIGTITVGLRTTSNLAQLVIIDDGCGIPTDVLEKIGQKGVSFGKKGCDSGFGLGIYHAKSIVEAAGGSFSIQSQESIGTMISISIPTTKT